MTSMIIMASHKIVLLFLFVAITYSATSDAQPTYLSHSCSSNKTFAANSAFQSDRTTLLSSLSSANTTNTDFYNATVAGSGDTVYGLFMCRGDVNLTTCHQCVVNATQRLTTECRASKEAITWYDECMVRYSNRSFFSTVDMRPRVGLLNTANASRPSFLEVLWDTLNLTADDAANDAKKYATREASISGFGTMYSLLQCTPDLSSQDCRTCLSAVIGDLSWCCVGKQGGRVLYPSCNVRYEFYAFYNSDDQPPEATTATPPALSPTNSSDPQVKAKGQSTRTIVIVVASSAGGLVIFFCLAYYLFKTLITKRRNSALRHKYFGNESNNLQPLQFSLATIEAATNKFSHEHCLG